MTTENIVMYGTDWCGDCHRAKFFFQQNDIAYDWINVDQDRDAADRIKELNGGYRSVPTIVFDDGSVLVEPSNAELARKFGIAPAAR